MPFCAVSTANTVSGQFEAATGYGTGAGLCGWSYRHTFFAIFPELGAPPAWTQESLEKLDARDIEYNGGRYTRYEISQMQRARERTVRKYKRRYLAEDAAGADTTVHNAIRDGAEWAWGPHGDACPFCRMLASNGWQKASKKLLKKGHAQHIHANCDCEFAVRFSREFGVSGYDPEKYLRQYRAAGSNINNWRRIDYAARKDAINAQKRAAYAAQAYRKDRGAASEISLVRRGEEISISVKRVASYKTPVFVSDKATIKPKALHEINQNTEKALADWGINLDRKPKIVIVSDNELRGAVGIYDPCENVVYYAESIGKKIVQDASGGSGAIEAHEMWHMKQAEDFRQSSGVITRENRAEYLDALCKKCKGHIDKLGITRNNVRELSQYAADMYLGERFDEVEAEFMSLRRRK